MVACDEELLREVDYLLVQNLQVIECWKLLQGGVALGWLQNEELQELWSFLSAGRDFGLEELLFSHSGSTLHVTLVNNVASCDTKYFLRLLGKLSIFNNKSLSDV